MLSHPCGAEAKAGHEGADETQMFLTAHDTQAPTHVDVAALEEPGYPGNREFFGERIEPLLEATLAAGEYDSRRRSAPHENRQLCSE